MTIFEAKSVDELKQCGKLVEVRKIFKDTVGSLGFNGKTNSWAAMFETIQKYNQVTGKPAKKEEKESSTWDDPFFKSEEAMYIFYLTQLDGEARADKLGINKIHYGSETAARRWMQNIAKHVHPDNSTHPYARQASEELNGIYAGMLGKN